MFVHRGEVKRKDCGSDLARALELKAKLEAVAEKKGLRAITLRSKNVSHPPPLKYADTEKVPIGRRKSTGKIVYKKQRTDPPVYRKRMKAFNKQGYWWCPYCMKLRKFVKRRGFYVDRIWVDEPGMHCPMCNVSHRDGNVQRYNPVAVIVAMNARKRRRSSRSSRRRRRVAA